MTGHSRALAVAGLVIAASIGCTKHTCRIPIAETGCTPTYEELSCSASSGPCGAFLVWFSGTQANISSLTCVYDRSGQHLLSGTACTDISVYCGGKEFCGSGGQSIDLSQSCDVTKLARACSGNPDAGGDATHDADAAGEAGADTGSDATHDADAAGEVGDAGDAGTDVATDAGADAG